MNDHYILSLIILAPYAIVVAWEVTQAILTKKGN